MQQKFELNRARLTSQTDRPLIPDNQPGERYALVTLQLPEVARQTERLPLNLSLIIDRSGSMSGDKLEYVKEAAIHTLQLLTEMDRVSAVIYDDEVEVIAPSRTLTAQTRDDLISRIRQVRTGGMTNLSGGWFTGCDQIADYMTPDYLNRALLLTDGLANRGLTDQEKLVYQAKELRRRGITTTTFGVGHDFNQFLLQGIADAGGGHFYFIDRPSQIPNYFQGELGEMLTTVAREMTLEIGLPAGVAAEVLNEVPHDQGRGKLRLLLGDAHAGEARTFVLKLDLPAHPIGRHLSLPFTLHYHDVQGQRVVTVEGTPLHFTVASARACKTQIVDETVLKEASRLEAEKAKMEALQMEYRGDVAGAQSALRQAGVLIAKTAPAAEAEALMDELTEMEGEMAKGMTEKARKKRHYAAYNVQRSRKDYKK